MRVRWRSAPTAWNRCVSTTRAPRSTCTSSEAHPSEPACPPLPGFASRVRPGTPPALSYLGGMAKEGQPLPLGLRTYEDLATPVGVPLRCDECQEDQWQ